MIIGIHTKKEKRKERNRQFLPTERRSLRKWFLRMLGLSLHTGGWEHWRAWWLRAAVSHLVGWKYTSATSEYPHPSTSFETDSEHLKAGYDTSKPTVFTAYLFHPEFGA